MTDKPQEVILITGATSGIGAVTARRLAEKGARILLHGRSPDRVKETYEAIQGETGSNTVEAVLADLSSIEKVRRFAREIRKREDRLDVLINNAGVGPGSDRVKREESQDGFELRFAVNYLGPFVLTLELLPLLMESAPSRIVNVSSIAQEALDFGDLMLEENYDGGRAYSRSKLALILFTFYLAKGLRKTGVTVNTLHPGTLLNTKMVREAFSHSLGEAAEGAEAEIYLATSSDLNGITGEYFNQKERDRAAAQAYDKGAQQRLWDLSLELTETSSPF